MEHIETRLTTLAHAYNLTADVGRLKLLSTATEMLAEYENPIERETGAIIAAKMTGVSLEAVRTEVRLAIKRAARKRAKLAEIYDAIKAIAYLSEEGED